MWQHERESYLRHGEIYICHKESKRLSSTQLKLYLEKWKWRLMLVSTQNCRLSRSHCLYFLQQGRPRKRNQHGRPQTQLNMHILYFGLPFWVMPVLNRLPFSWVEKLKRAMYNWSLIMFCFVFRNTKSRETLEQIFESGEVLNAV